MEKAAIEACARACHEANLAYCEAVGYPALPPWNEALEYMKESSRAGVVGVIAGHGPEQSHESWLADRRARGWHYGLEKDEIARTHPCMVPYADLLETQRRKDDVFVETARTMARALGLMPA
jgi:hypothetical protein